MELWFEVLLNLPYDEVIKTSELDKRIRNLCNNEFWQKYIQKHYFITRKTNNNNKGIAFYANKLLKDFYSRNLYPSFRVLSFIFECLFNEILTLDDITEIISKCKNKFLSLEDITNNLTKFKKRNSKRLYKSISMEISNKLSKPGQGKEFFIESIDIILQPTIYLTPDGQIDINFDIDKFDIIHEKYSKFEISKETLDYFGNYGKILISQIFDIGHDKKSTNL